MMDLAGGGEAGAACVVVSWIEERVWRETKWYAR